MRKIILLILSLCAVVSSCQKFDDTEIWDSINKLDERVQTLEQLCREMNTNIGALQSLVNALQTQDYITNVSPIQENGYVIGYTISFAYGDPITIYHGKDGQNGRDGKDGANGQDGQTPVVGVVKDIDGIYYWTLNGQWMVDENGQKIKAVGTDGKDGVDGTDGKDGADGNDGAPGQNGTPGKDGTDGKDGITPKLKIENGMWYVSYDNGTSWIEVGQATGDQGPQGETGATGPQGPQGETGSQGPAGANGQDGQDGDAFFQGVDYTTNTDYVIFTLADGSQIKIPTWSAFEALKVQCDLMNKNIEAISGIVNALQNNDYVTNVTPIYEGVKEIGYIINFSQSGKVTIYHGQDGKDGQDGANGNDGAPGQNGTDGKDGVTPVIGVAKDTDGIYYWTVNGSWLLDENGRKVKAEGRDGQDGTNGTNGSNGANGNDGAPGQDGADGKDGQDGITPKLKIENGMWYVSYDNGTSWIEVGQATGDQGPQGETGATGPQGPQGETGSQGPAGANGQDGDAFFQGVDYTSNADYVIFTLADGTQFKVPTWSAFEALKQQCERMNSNIEALSTVVNALQNNDYVTSVTPIYEGGKETGYIINFSQSGKVTIYHGQDGKDGQDGANGNDGAPGQNGTDGKDGVTPVIGVAKDTDGIYYWTVNGSWLLDENGQKVQAEGRDGQDGTNGANGSNGVNGNDGAPGQDGADGKDGQDGITPKLKIENGMWYVSYDNGASWIKVGQATGDQGPQGATGPQGPQGETGSQGPAGTDGQDGDAFFQGVDYTTNTDYVVFTLADGTQFKVPTWSAFEALKQQCEQMNANIEALSTVVNALQNNDYVTSVTPIYEGGKETGYIINFSQSGKVTIYHGQDGKDGQDGANGNDGAPGQNGTDGKDGVTPVIGVAKDTDGVYYWTVNGSWLLDENGQKVKAVGTDGQDGAQGNTGATGPQGPQGDQGIAGITPKLKIENGMWYVSYDNGTSWIEVGQATGDQGPQGETGATGPQGPQGETGSQGPAGANGQDGDAFFQGVDYTTNTDYVIFTLADGTQFKVPTWSAFEALKQQCERMNSNIEALSTVVNALQNNDYVTGVTPIYEGGKETGYIINFSQSGKVTIYHGQDGKDGQDGANGNDGAPGQNGTDGKDGVTPVIGVAKDTDGIYYWTVNGSWLLDDESNKIKAVGINGQDGTQGVDGITPQLKIEGGRWYVSYDDGKSWSDLGQATGDAGTNGQDGDSFFQSVTEDEENVYMTLADGTEITLPKTPSAAATLTFDKATGFTATFNGTVYKHSLDLKVTVYYSTVDNLTIYKNKGKVSVTEFNGDAFTLKLTDLAAETTYYYFTEVICNGNVKYSEISSFRTDKADAYVDWGEGENIGGDI